MKMLLPNILIGIFAFISFCGMIAEKDANTKKYITISFSICIAGIVIFNLFGGAK